MLGRSRALTHEQPVQPHKTSRAAPFMSLPAAARHVRRYVQSHRIKVDLPGVPASAGTG